MATGGATLHSSLILAQAHFTFAWGLLALETFEFKTLGLSALYQHVALRRGKDVAVQ